MKHYKGAEKNVSFSFLGLFCGLHLLFLQWRGNNDVMTCVNKLKYFLKLNYLFINLFTVEVDFRLKMFHSVQHIFLLMNVILNTNPKPRVHR